MPKPNKAAVTGGPAVSYIEGRDHTYGFSSVPSGKRSISRREFFRVIFVEDENAPNGFATRWVEVGAVEKSSWDDEWSVVSISPRFRTPDVGAITGKTAKAAIKAAIEEIESWA